MLAKHNLHVRKIERERRAAGTTGAQNLITRPSMLPEVGSFGSNPAPARGIGLRQTLETTAAAGASATTTAAALTRLVAVPAKDRAIATRFKRHCCRLSATRTNHRCSLCRSRTVAGAPLIVLLCLTAILATLWGRITTFLEERLIRSGEGKVLPAIAALKLNISGHGSPRGDCTAQCAFFAQGIFMEKRNLQTGLAMAGALRPALEGDAV